MATVAEIMTREVVTLDPDTSLRDALEVFRGATFLALRWSGARTSWAS